jgi:hypothetical protein
MGSKKAHYMLLRNRRCWLRLLLQQGLKFWEAEDMVGRDHMN